MAVGDARCGGVRGVGVGERRAHVAAYDCRGGPNRLRAQDRMLRVQGAGAHQHTNRAFLAVGSGAVCSGVERRDLALEDQLAQRTLVPWNQNRRAQLGMIGRSHQLCEARRQEGAQRTFTGRVQGPGRPHVLRVDRVPLLPLLISHGSGDCLVVVATWSWMDRSGQTSHL